MNYRVTLKGNMASYIPLLLVMMRSNIGYDKDEFSYNELLMTPSSPVGLEATSKDSTSHLAYLDGIRALAAIFVMMHHAMLQVRPHTEPLTGWSQPAMVFYYGRYAVNVFIVLSGFCLMLPVLRNDGFLRGGALNFLKRRAWRILPPYYLAIGFSLLLITTLIHDKTGTHWDVSIPVTARSVTAQMLLLGSGFGEGLKINHVFWSISVEWWIYFLFPLLVLGWQRWGPFYVTGVTCVASSGLLFWVLRFTGLYLSVHYLGLFALGMLAASFAFPAMMLRSFHVPQMAQHWRVFFWTLMTILFSLVVAVVSLVPLWHGKLLPPFIADYCVGVWACCLLIMTAAQDQNYFTRFFSWKPLVFVGTFAYSLYLIHAPLLQVLWQYPFASLQPNPRAMFVALTCVGIPLITGVAYGFFLLCERPFLLRGRQKRQSIAVSTPVEPAS